MANKVYPLYKQALIQGITSAALTGTLKVALVDTGVYTYSDGHEFLTSLTGVVGNAQTLTTKTYASGVLDAADVSFLAVTGATVEALVLFLDTGDAATSRLVAYFDTGVTGLPVTPNGGNIPIVWNASGIIAF